MKNINFRCPDDLWAWLKARAAENERSLNSELVVCLKSAQAGLPLDGEPPRVGVRARIGELHDEQGEQRMRTDRYFINDREVSVEEFSDFTALPTVPFHAVHVFDIPTSREAAGENWRPRKRAPTSPPSDPRA